MKSKDLTEKQKALLGSKAVATVFSCRKCNGNGNGNNFTELEDATDDDIVAVLTASLIKNHTLLEACILVDRSTILDSILKEVKGRKGVLQKILGMFNKLCQTHF